MTEPTLKALLNQPFTAANQKTLLDYLFGDTLTEFEQPRILVEDTENIWIAQHTGSVRLSDGRNLAIMDVALKDKVHINRNRRGLRDIVADYIDQNMIFRYLKQR